jgi:hypothetical protein
MQLKGRASASSVLNIDPTPKEMTELEFRINNLGP